MSTESTEPSTPPEPMTTTSRELGPTTKKATKSRSKMKAKKVWVPKVKEENLQPRIPRIPRTRKEQRKKELNEVLGGIILLGKDLLSSQSCKF